MENGTSGPQIYPEYFWYRDTSASEMISTRAQSTTKNLSMSKYVFSTDIFKPISGFPLTSYKVKKHVYFIYVIFISTSFLSLYMICILTCSQFVIWKEKRLNSSSSIITMALIASCQLTHVIRDTIFILRPPIIKPMMLELNSLPIIIFSGLVEALNRTLTEFFLVRIRDFHGIIHLYMMHN